MQADPKIARLVTQLQRAARKDQNLRRRPRDKKSDVTKNGYFLGDHDLLYRAAGTYKREAMRPEVVNFDALVISAEDSAAALRGKIMRHCHAGLFAAHMGRHASCIVPASATRGRHGRRGSRLCAMISASVRSLQKEQDTHHGSERLPRQLSNRRLL